MRDMIHEREKALENEFFAKRERELLARMRAETEAADGREALAKVTLIRDTGLLNSLLAAGVRAESVASLTLVPLVFVAWGDHRMVDVERRAVLQSAHDLGVDPEGAPAELLEGWLDQRPPEKLFGAWKEWIRLVARSLPPEERERLARKVLDHCREVAQAAGGFLETGIPIEPGQRDVIEEIEAAFENLD